MKAEVKRYYHQTLNGNAIIDKEASTPIHDISDEVGIKTMEFLESQGLKRHEDTKSYFYSSTINSHESIEYIFYK